MSVKQVNTAHGRAVISERNPRGQLIKDTGPVPIRPERSGFTGRSSPSTTPCRLRLGREPCLCESL